MVYQGQSTQQILTTTKQNRHILNESNFKTDKTTRELCAQNEFILISVTYAYIAYA
jgi:hypothetical protein